MRFFKKFRELLGVNLKEAKCPECSTVQPKRRKPKNMRQALWGGSTCQECGTELDKWAKRVE